MKKGSVKEKQFYTEFTDQISKHIPLKLVGEIMYYIKVVFNAEVWGKLVYGFKVNMICGELEITYDNFQGGYTTKGIKLNRKQHTHLKQLSRIENFKKFRENMDKFIPLFGPYRWSLQCISNDGDPMLEIPDRSGDYITRPNFVINLVEYIAKIGIEPELIERMSLL